MKILILAFLLAVNVYLCASSEVVKAVLESCPGCSLKRLEGVRNFAYDDLPNYDRVEWNKINGKLPELVFFNDKDEEVERYPLMKLSREECNDLLLSKGFSRKNKEL